MKIKIPTLVYGLAILLFIGLIPNSVIAQDEKPKFIDNVRFGGGLGLSFGNRFFSATVAPSAIYEFNQKFAAGLGLNFTYRSEKDFYNSTILGGSIIGLYNVIPEIQLSAEFEPLNENRNYADDLILPATPEPLETNFWYTALFVGVGYRADFVTVGIRYDLLYEEDESIYGTAWLPFVRLYF